MILNKYDYIFFVDCIKVDFLHNPYKLPLIDRLNYLRCGIIDYIFHGGQVCNKHNEYHCKQCRATRLSYKLK